MARRPLPERRTMMTSRTAAAFGCMAAALAATPSLAQDSGWYGGAGVGRSAATIDDGRITSGLAGQGLATTGIAGRDRDTGYKLFGGYQLNRNFAIEGGWFDLGEMGFTATTSPPGTLSGDVRLRGLNLDLVGTLPLSERFALLGRVGVAHAQTRGRFAASGAVALPYAGASTSERNTGVKFGAGVAWKLADAWELRAEGERYRIDDSVGNKGHVDLLSVSLVYRFGSSPQRARPVAAVAAPMLAVAALPAAADCRDNRRTPAPVACLQPDRRDEAHVDGMRQAAP